MDTSWNKRKNQLDIRKQFLPRESSNAGPGVQRVCGISILGEFKPRLEETLSNLI